MVASGGPKWLCDAVADSESGRGRPVIDADLAVDAREVINDDLLAQRKGFSDDTIAHSCRDKAQYLGLTRAESGRELPSRWRPGDRSQTLCEPLRFGGIPKALEQRAALLEEFAGIGGILTAFAC